MPPAAQGQTPAEFYKGKQVSLYIGYSVGGGYDLYARMLARHMGKHIPGNPTIIPRNMEGAAACASQTSSIRSRQRTAPRLAPWVAAPPSLRCSAIPARNSTR